MTVQELYRSICAAGGNVPATTVDTVKAGDVHKPVTKLAVCFIATPAVIRQAVAFGADMLLTHEPTFYTNDDTADTDEITRAKQQLVADSGLTICRLHDGIHLAQRDIIVESLAKQSGLTGFMPDQKHLQLSAPITPHELAKQIKVRCGLQHIRVVGAADVPVTNLALHVGAPYGEEILKDLKSGRAECVVVGEVCEWAIGEYVRDAVQMGFTRSLVILGHVGSERDGMRELADRIGRQYADIDTRYLECGEIYC